MYIDIDIHIYHLRYDPLTLASFSLSFLSLSNSSRAFRSASRNSSLCGAASSPDSNVPTASDSRPSPLSAEPSL